MDDWLLIPVWIVHGTKRHQRRAGVLLQWELRDRTWWALVAEVRPTYSSDLRRGRERRLSWYAAGQLQQIR